MRARLMQIINLTILTPRANPLPAPHDPQSKRLNIRSTNNINGKKSTLRRRCGHGERLRYPP
jgi:hypothetical protein